MIERSAHRTAAPAHIVDVNKMVVASSGDITRNEAEGRTPASPEPAVTASPTLPAVVAGSPISDIDIEYPEFLIRNPDNTFRESVPTASPCEAQSVISGEARG
jgi:hypothetical protein